VIRATAGLILALAGTPALAAPDFAQEQFACDSPSGRYSRYHRPLGSDGLTVSVTVQINQLHAIPEWQPVANLMVSGGETTRRVGFRILVPQGEKRARIFAVLPGFGANDGMLLGAFELNSPLPLTIKADDQRTSVTVGSVTRSGPALLGAHSIDLSCSSIDVHFDDIVAIPMTPEANP
jgi:hypothetical protein